MTIYRVNPSNWATGSRVTKSQVTLLDKDISYGIDKKQGNTDIVSSGITVAAGGGGNGGATFQSGSSIDIQDPAIIEIDDGNMAIDCQIIGDKQPIRHGYIKMIGNGSGSYSILPSAYYQHNHFKLTGTLTGVFEITIPNTAGVEKFFEGAFSAGEASDGYVKLTTGGTDTVVIELEQIIVFIPIQMEYMR